MFQNQLYKNITINGCILSKIKGSTPSEAFNL